MKIGLVIGLGPLTAGARLRAKEWRGGGPSSAALLRLIALGQRLSETAGPDTMPMCEPSPTCCLNTDQ